MQERSARKAVFLFSVFAVSAVLTGCGSDSEKDYSEDRSIVPDAVISGFSVVGTSPAQGDIIPVNAGVEDGRFTIDWDVTSANSFQLRIFLSHDELLSADDTRLFSNPVCGSVRLNECYGQDQYICHFNSDNGLICSDGWENFSQNLLTTGFLTTLPQAAYVIGEVCVVTDCKTAAIKIEFQ